MSDFLKKAAGIFFTVDDTEEQAVDKSRNIVNSGAAATYVAPPVATVSAINAGSNQPDAAATEKFRAYFKNLYDKANQPGPDFYEYHNMVEAMGNLIADDVKYPSVYAGFAGMVTKEKLLSTGAQYLEMLQTDRSDFDRSLTAARTQKVASRKEQAEKKAAQIKALQEQIAALNNDIIQLNSQAGEDEARLAAEQVAYYQQSDAFMQKIKSGLEKINLFVKG